jgi:hypothetical protein
MASKKSSKSSKAASQPPTAELVHSEATATMLSFANPPVENDPQTVATDCSRQGFTAIGINIVSGAQIIDFSLIDPNMCADLAAAIEICVDTKGFFIPALTGTLQILNQKAVQITFTNFAKAIAQLIKPKSAVLGA